MRHPFKSFALCLLLALLASGCTMVGPDYQSPSAPVQNDWLEYEDPQLVSTEPVAKHWWKAAFNDPILDQLVETALAQNLSLRSAGLRVLQARQNLAIAIGNQYPQEQQVSGQAGIAGVSSSAAYEIYDLGFNLSWEADVWGRFSRQIESATATLDASLSSYDGIIVSLVAEVAQTYLLIRTTEQRLTVAKHNLALQGQSLQITVAKYEGGEVSALDVEQAQTLYYSTESSLASLEQSLQQFKNSLAILLGQPPHNMRVVLGPAAPMPVVSPAIAVGMPQNLIRHRPDIRTAERQLAAQSALIGFAVSDLYPQFSLGGSIATDVSTNGSLNFDDLFSSETVSYNLLGGFQWNIFQYGRLKNNIRLQDAIFQQLLEDYRQTVLQAQGEVENAIVAFFKSQQQLLSLQSAAAAAQRAVDIASVQYEGGEVPYNTVITTLQSLVSQQDQFAAIQGTVATNLVALYKSLGGGWEVRTSTDPLDLIDEQTRQEMLERTDYWNKTFKGK